MRFNYSKLKGRIIEICGMQKVFATRLGVSECALTSKLTGHTYFTQGEIKKATEILFIDQRDIYAYFFTV